MHQLQNKIHSINHTHVQQIKNKKVQHNNVIEKVTI